MKTGIFDYQELKSSYNKIDYGVYGGCRWELFEIKRLRGVVESIAVNLSKGYYVYTYESLYYTSKHVYDEFELYLLADDSLDDLEL
jgi:hypothetical protein